MERGCVALERKAKIPIPVASYRVFRNFCHNPKGFRHRTFATKWILTYHLNSSRAACSAEFKFKPEDNTAYCRAGTLSIKSFAMIYSVWQNSVPKLNFP